MHCWSAYFQREKSIKMRKSLVRETKSGSLTKYLQTADKKYDIENAETQGKKCITAKPQAGKVISKNISQEEGNKLDQRN